MKISNKIKIAVISFSLLLNSCRETASKYEGSDADAAAVEYAEISEKYILKTNSEIKNLRELGIIASEVNPNINQTLSSGNTFSGSFNLAAFKQKFDEAFRGIDINAHERVSLKDEVFKLFDPDNSLCDLPRKVKNRLKKLKERKKPWAPKYIVEHIKGLPDSVLRLPRTSISVLIHNVYIKSANDNSNTTRKIPLFSAPTFKNLDIERFVITQGFDTFFYSLDCSGYLNVAIEGSGVVPGADIQGSAKAAMDSKKSMFVAGGIITSPITAAFYGNFLGTDLSTSERIKILEELAKIPLIKDTDKIIVPSNYEAIWVSKEGSSSFNGSAEFGGKFNAGIGFASLSTNTNAGSSLTRKSSFNSFNTYITNRKIMTELSPFTIQEVKTKITELKTQNSQ
ncbi:hypothetical protein [Aquimarina algiphila]|uniref:hypothetical protein n=1 Tax=Aquimarina algiphila TaxID=2047982 RepID=UPI0023302AE9|nr:hypothetical protein [Aquimarina algiphila]